jgi:hypothetical protein
VISVLVSRPGDRGFEPQSGQTKDSTIDMCCFFETPTALRSVVENYIKISNCIQILPIGSGRWYGTLKCILLVDRRLIDF